MINYYKPQNDAVVGVGHDEPVYPLSKHQLKLNSMGRQKPLTTAKSPPVKGPESQLPDRQVSLNILLSK